MNQEWIKVEQANLNIATELSILMKKKEDYDILMQEMEERNKAFVQDRENIVQQQAHVLMEVEEMRRKVSCIPIINPAFVHKIEGLKKKIADSKERKLKQDAIYNETHIEYENTLQGLINQQKQILGIASSVNYESDQSNTSSSPFFKSMSQTSDIQLIEKVDVTVMSNATASSFVS